jgi:hypothetical protein
MADIFERFARWIDKYRRDSAYLMYDSVVINSSTIDITSQGMTGQLILFRTPHGPIFRMFWLKGDSIDPLVDMTATEFGRFCEEISAIRSQMSSELAP